MRWNRKDILLGTERTRVKFLWLPRTLGGETRWLEFAKVQQRYMRTYESIWEEIFGVNRQWVDVCWV